MSGAESLSSEEKRNAAVENLKPGEVKSGPEIVKAANKLARECIDFVDNVIVESTAPDDVVQIKKLVVAVHGIGDQYRFATIQAVARQIAKISGVASPFPLGGFHPPFRQIRALRFDVPGTLYDGVGFAEVFWADIHQRAQATHDTIEESKAWARTILERMKLVDRGKVAVPEGKVGKDDVVDYRKVGSVLSEMIETIETLDNLCFLAEKAGIFKFNLRDLLDDYIGAVQLVAEFKDYGGWIFRRFSSEMRDLLARHQEVEEIYIVAHSEGTVVSFREMLFALSSPGGENEGWVKKVRGYMTIGSPIDKHIVMFPEMWKQFWEQNGKSWEENGVKLERGPIVWWNYYDLGDPVGFKLDSAQEWLLDHKWVKPAVGQDGKVTAAKQGQPFFQFPSDQDIGFSRYLFPGKAHNDYWGDEGVFQHFFGQVLPDVKKKPDVPKTIPMQKALCWTMPYLLCFVILEVATYILCAASAPLFNADSDVLQLARMATGIALLIAGITCLSRVPRLTKFGWWYLLPMGVFALGELGFHWLSDPMEVKQMEKAFTPWNNGSSGVSIDLIAVVIGVASAIISKVKPKWGMKPLMVLSSFATGCILVHQWPQDNKAPLIKVLLAAAAFIYLWWLVALIFDLVFVWHRYICTNAASGIFKSLRHKRVERRKRGEE